MTETQNYTRWFTAWPSTHRFAGQTVEVTPAAEVDRLRVVADEAFRSLQAARPVEAMEYLRGIV